MFHPSVYLALLIIGAVILVVVFATPGVQFGGAVLGGFCFFYGGISLLLD